MEKRQQNNRSKGRTLFHQVRKVTGTHPAAFVGILAAFAAALWMEKAADQEHKVQQEIASQVVRFHVKANSDTIRDQQIKLEVRDALLSQINHLLEESGCSSKTASEKLLEEELCQLQETANQAAAAAGSSDPIQVTLGKSYFPEKTYGDYTLPAGTYDALQVTIGEGKGHNWWCMLYPSLCFSDALHPVLEEEGEEQLKTVLSDDAYDYILKNAKITFGFYWF
ncbi:MAG: stage II sporulation protein R [Fusicatenibacter sp.]|nr:stage II sporulation protein R [Fusicatenibacter sp.]